MTSSSPKVLPSLSTAACLTSTAAVVTIVRHGPSAQSAQRRHATTSVTYYDTASNGRPVTSLGEAMAAGRAFGRRAHVHHGHVGRTNSRRWTRSRRFRRGTAVRASSPGGKCAGHEYSCRNRNRHPTRGDGPSRTKQVSYTVHQGSSLLAYRPCISWCHYNGRLSVGRTAAGYPRSLGHPTCRPSTFNIQLSVSVDPSLHVFVHETRVLSVVNLSEASRRINRSLSI